MGARTAAGVMERVSLRHPWPEGGCRQGYWWRLRWALRGTPAECSTPLTQSGWARWGLELTEDMVAFVSFCPSLAGCGVPANSGRSL